MTFKTEQERFWAGEFGDAYIERNRSLRLVAANVALFARILRHADSIGSVLELGANIGLNLQAIRELLPQVQLSAVEINDKAVHQLRAMADATVYHQSILDFAPETEYDLAFTKTVLIHIDPQFLSRVYDLLYKGSRRFICLVEYYNPVPVEIDYRGHKKRLFKRDFAGEMMDRFPGLALVDYGFVYHRDIFAQDDLTWFLLKKN